MTSQELTGRFHLYLLLIFKRRGRPLQLSFETALYIEALTTPVLACEFPDLACPLSIRQPLLAV